MRHRSKSFRVKIYKSTRGRPKWGYSLDFTGMSEVTQYKANRTGTAWSSAVLKYPELRKKV